MTCGGKNDGVGDEAEGSKAATVRQEMNDLKFQMESQMGVIQGDTNGL